MLSSPKSEISGSQGGEYEDNSFLGFSGIHSG
jgi:hypothetical protein